MSKNNKGNKVKSKETKINILGKEYPFVFDLDLLEKLEDATKANPFNPKFWDDMSPKRLIIVLHTIVGDESVTQLQIKKGVNLASLGTITASLKEAFDNSQPDVDEIDNAEEPEKK